MIFNRALKAPRLSVEITGARGPSGVEIDFLDISGEAEEVLGVLRMLMRDLYGPPRGEPCPDV